MFIIDHLKFFGPLHLFQTRKSLFIKGLIMRFSLLPTDQKQYARILATSTKTQELHQSQAQLPSHPVQGIKLPPIHGQRHVTATV